MRAKKLLSGLLLLAMLCGIISPAAAVSKPTAPADGISIFMDDVRVEAGSKGTAKVEITYDLKTNYDQINSGSLLVSVPTDTTGISGTTPAVLEQGYTGAGQVRANSKFLTTGTGNIGYTSVPANVDTVTFEFSVPAVSATTKVSISPREGNMFIGPLNNQQEVPLSNIRTAVGSFIVQYPVTVTVEGNIPTGGSIAVNTTAYNGKNTFDRNGTPTPLTTGEQFWVDSGKGQQNTPVLNVTAPEGYRAQVKLGDGNYADAGLNYSLGEITAATNVSVKFVEGELPVSSIAVTDTTGPYTLSTYAVELKTDGSQGNTVAPKNYDGYTVVRYKLNGGNEETISADGKVTINLNKRSQTIEFIYERADKSVVVPGPDGKLAPPDDKDNVTIQPTDDTKEPTVDNGTGSVTVPEGGATVSGKDGILVVPKDTVVDKEGNVKLPGATETIKPGQTDPMPKGFYRIVYRSKEGTGKLPEQIILPDTTANALGIPASFQITGREFVEWNTMLEGTGDKYAENAELPVNTNLILWAQWKDKGVDYGDNKITITYYKDASKAEAAEQILGDPAATTFKGTLTPNKTFTLDSWTLVGWNTAANGSGTGTPYALNAQITRTKADGDLTLYAQWIKEGDNSITVPGPDGIPGNANDATAVGSGTKAPERDGTTGIITVPSGGKVTTDDGKTEYPMPNGGTLKPDGTITITQPGGGGDIIVEPGKDPVIDPTDPDAANKKVIIITYESGVAGIASQAVTAVVAKNGGTTKIVSGETLFPREGYKFAYWKNADGKIIAVDSDQGESITLTANWYAVDKDGNITVPKDPDGGVVVKPDPTDPDNPDKKPEVDDNGNVVVPPGGEVETKPDGGTTTLPDGGKVTPGGEIVVPDPNNKPDGTVTIKPNDPTTWPTGYYAVVYEKNGANATGTMAKQIGKDLVALVNGFTNGDLTFLAWNTETNGTGTGYKPGVKIPAPGADVTDKTITLHAVWGKVGADGSITVPGKDGSVDPDNGGDNVTVKPGEGGGTPGVDDNGNVTVPGGGTVKKEPDGTEITPPGGSVVTPGGEIKTPDGTTIDPSNPNTWPAGWFTVEYLANDDSATGTMGQQLVKDKTNALTNAFTNVGKQFVAWNTEANGSGVVYKEGAEITAPTTGKKVTLYAIWSIVTTDPTDPTTDGSITVPGPNGKLGDDDDVTVRPNGEGGKPAWREDKSGVNVPDGGKVEYPGDKVIVPPNGSWVKPDGTIVLPDDKTIDPVNPEKPIEGYVTITFMPNRYGSGTMPVQYAKKDAENKLFANGFTAGAGKTFDAWHTDANGLNGTRYTDGQIIPANTLTENLVLWAQWVDEDAANKATVTFKANDGKSTADKTQTITSASASISGKLDANTFTLTLTDWKFNGWNTQADGNGTPYVNEAVVTLTNGQNLELFAQWIKVADDGSITMPGSDGKPGTTDDVTVKPNPDPGAGEDGKPKPNPDGTITVPEGGSVDTPTGEIELPEGGTVKPDGTIIIPDPTDPDKPGTEVDPAKPETPPTGTYLVTYDPGAATGSNKVKYVYVKTGSDHIVLANNFTYDGHVFVYWTDENGGRLKVGRDTVSNTATITANWLVQKDDGTIVIPDPDNKPDGTIEVKPDPENPGKKPEVDDNGDITVPPGGEVEKKPGGGSVELPGGGTVTVPDGEIKLPDGTTVDPTDPKPTGYFTITYDANDASATGTMPKQVSKTAVQALANKFAVANKNFLSWNTQEDGKGDSYSAGDTLPTQNTTLYAQWQSADAGTLATVVFDFAGGVDAQGNGAVHMTGKAGTDIPNEPTPTLAGHVFGNWDNTVLKFGAAGTVTVFTAQWAILPYDVTFSNDDTKGTMTGYTTPIKVEYGSSVDAADIPTVTAEDAYVFIGWRNSVNGSLYTHESIQHYIVTEDVTFTAEYADAADATVIFIFAGGTVGTAHSEIRTGTPGDAIGALPIPDRDGYTLNGWDPTIADDAVFDAAGSVNVYTAQWTEDQKQTFTVDFVIDTAKGSTADATSEQVEKGSFVQTVPAVTAEDGYRFVGWKDEQGRLFYAAGIQLYPITANTTFTAEFVDDNTNPNPPAQKTLTVSANKTTAKRGDTVDFTAYLDGVKEGNVTWSVTGGQSGTTINASGVLTIGSSETNGTVLTITATYDDAGTILTATKTVVVIVDSNTGGNTGGGGSGGGSTRPTKPTIKDDEDKDPTKNPETNVTLPEFTGVADWLKTDVHDAYMTGVGNGLFAPNANMTRAQVAQMFYNLLKDKSASAGTTFSDVPSDAWYTEAVNTLAALGIIGGSNGKFRPNDPITRAEFVAIAMRFAGTVRGAKASFSDVSRDAWYYESIANAVEYGWIGGYTDGTFRPNKPITRAEVVSITNRMLNRSFDTDVRATTVTRFTDVATSHWAFAAIAEATTSHDHTFKNGVESWDW